MRVNNFIACISGCLLLAGCAGTTKRPVAPVTEATAEQRPVQRPSSMTKPADKGGSIQIRAYDPSVPKAVAPVHSSAVTSLVKSAQLLESAGDLTAAVGTIERALRIEPRNAHLWNQLAHLRFSQGRISPAADLAMKSMALAGGDIALKRDNWRLIARARRGAGDVASARVADRKARMLH